MHDDVLSIEEAFGDLQDPRSRTPAHCLTEMLTVEGNDFSRRAAEEHGRSLSDGIVTLADRRRKSTEEAYLLRRLTDSG